MNPPLESGFDDPTLPSRPEGQRAPCPEGGSNAAPPSGLAPRNEPTTPSDAPTPETDAQCIRYSNGDLASFAGSRVVEADHARRLERERDEARAELAKLKANNRYQRGFQDGEQSAREELKTPTPPTEGSAVEWVTMEWRGKERWDLCAQGVVLIQDLKFREAERARITLNAQLADLRAQLTDECDNARQCREEIEALKGDVAAAQSEATDLRVSWQNALARERGLREALQEAVHALWYYNTHDCLTTEQQQKAFDAIQTSKGLGIYYAALDKKEGRS